MYILGGIPNIGYNKCMSEENRDVKPWDLFDPDIPRSSEEDIDHIYSICQGCEFFSKNTKRCKKCGCFMKLKTTLKMAKCPVGKW